MPPEDENELTPELTLEEDIAQTMFPAEDEVVLETEVETPVAELVVEDEPEVEVTEAPTVVQIGGRDFQAEDLEKVVAFADWAKENPEAWLQLQELENQAVTELQPLPTVESEEDEWVDPELRIAKLEGQIGALLQERMTQTKTEVSASLQTGIAEFQAKHPELPEPEVDQVLVELRDLGLLPRFREKYAGRPVEAVTEALEAAYRVKFYDRAPSRQPATESESRARRRAAAVAPSNVSAPRIDPEPETKEERKQALVSDIREALHGRT